ncbi:MAG: HEAT repeat domain-containing protein [bacterium]|nr:HEAT repeat domain-containing protein [bacterium]
MKKKWLLSIGLVFLLGNGESRLEELLEALTTERNRQWNEPAAELGRLGEVAVEPLVRILMDPESSAWTRRKVAWTLGYTRSEQAVEPLIEAFGDPAVEVRRAAGSALGEIGEPAIGPLARVLREAGADLRLEAAIAVGRIEPNAAAETLLVATVGDKDPNVRRVAALTLGERGNAKAVGVLVEILRHGEEYEQSRAARYVGEMKAVEAVDALVGALNEDVWRVRLSARDALVEIGDAAVEPLLSAATDGNRRVRMKAASALGKLGSERAVGVLLAALKNRDWMVRDEAAVALARIRSEKAVGPLIAALKDPNGETRQAAAWVLGEMESTSAVDALSELLADPEAGWMAAVALGKIGSEGDCP